MCVSRVDCEWWYADSPALEHPDLFLISSFSFFNCLLAYIALIKGSSTSFESFDDFDSTLSLLFRVPYHLSFLKAHHVTHLFVQCEIFFVRLLIRYSLIASLLSLGTLSYFSTLPPTSPMCHFNQNTPPFINFLHYLYCTNLSTSTI